jgi:hypothetical protein
MKKLLILLFICVSVIAGAQKAFTLGVTANSGSDMRKKDNSHLPVSKGNAYGAFLEYKLGIPVSLSLGFNAEKHHQEYSYTDTSGNISFTRDYKYNSFPFLIHVFFKGFFYSSGIALNMLKESDYTSGGVKKTESLPADLRTFSCIQEVGGYYALKQKFIFSVSGRYTIPMSKDYPYDLTPGLFTINASVAYRFTKGGGGGQLN